VTTAICARDAKCFQNRQIEDGRFPVYGRFVTHLRNLVALWGEKPPESRARRDGTVLPLVLRPVMILSGGVMNARGKKMVMVPVIGLAFLCLAGLAACGSGEIAYSFEPVFNLEPLTGNGNGSPSGAHYNLNIIGVPKDKTADMTNNNGHRIFAKLWGNTKILLKEGESFQVLDANGTDGSASFMLPNPDPDNDGITEYSVFARALGTPGGNSTTTTCAYDADGEEWCSSGNPMILVRDKGKQSFRNVSRELLYIYADLDEDGDYERYPLFDDALMDYFWNHDNNGLKLAQLRFYEVATQVD
jgi:hypothetical protein